MDESYPWIGMVAQKDPTPLTHFDNSVVTSEGACAHAHVAAVTADTECGGGSPWPARSCEHTQAMTGAQQMVRHSQSIADYRMKEASVRG